MPYVFLPWTLAWPVAFLAARAALAPGADPARASAVRFLTCFVGLGVCFFSLSAGKRTVYLLPLVPALALLVGYGLDVSLSAAVRSGRAWLERVALAALGLLVAVDLAVFAFYLPTQDASRSIQPAAVAAAAAAPIGTRIGLLRNGALVGGVAYYSGRPVERLGSAKGVRRFLEAGGRVLIAERADLPIVESVAKTEVTFRQRIEEDEMVVLLAQQSSAAGGDGP